MGEYKKSYNVLFFLGMIPILLSFGISYYNYSNLFWEFGIITLSFGFSVAIKLIINRYMQAEAYNLLNVLALNNMFKIMLAMFYFYLIVYHEQTHLDLLILGLQSYLLDMMSLVIGYYLATKHFKKYISTPIITGCFLLVVMLTGSLNQIQAVYVLKGSIILSVVVTCLISIQWRVISQEILHEKFPVFKIILVYRVMHYLVSYACIWQAGKYKSVVITFQLLHVFYLFCCAYYVSIVSPWEQRIHELNQAEDKIYEQSRNCSIIVNLSHELKTPVNVIRSALDIFMVDFRDTNLIEYIKGIKKDCNQVMNIIQDMIDIQKINGGYIEPKYQMYNLVELIEHVIDAFSEEVLESHLIFDPQEEEINNTVDSILIQKGMMLLLGLIIREDATKSLYITMKEEAEKKQISIEMMHTNISHLELLCKEVSTSNDEETNGDSIADRLTLELLYAILKLHEGEIIFDKQDNENVLKIYLKKKEDGKVIRLDDRSVAVLNDQIRCRYVGA